MDGGEEIPPRFREHVEIQFGQVKAMVYLAYGLLNVDCEAITRAAFQHTLEVWPVTQPIKFTRVEALQLAAAATRGRNPTRDMANVSVEATLGPVVSQEVRDALRAVDCLPRQARFVFLCVHIFGLTNDQVAKLIAREEATVRNHLHKAKVRLRNNNVDPDKLKNDLDEII